MAETDFWIMHVLDVCTHLSHIQKQSILAVCNRTPPPIDAALNDDDCFFEPHDVLTFLTADLLQSTGLLEDGVLLPLMDELYYPLHPLSEIIVKSGGLDNDLQEVVGLVIQDRRYLGLSRHDRFIDLTTLKELRTPPTPFLESVCYNLSTLYDRKVAELPKDLPNDNPAAADAPAAQNA